MVIQFTASTLYNKRYRIVSEKPLEANALVTYTVQALYPDSEPEDYIPLYISYSFHTAPQRLFEDLASNFEASE